MLTLLQDNGQPLSLVNLSSIALVFSPMAGSPSTNQRFVASGSVVVTDPTAAKASFLPSAADNSKLLAGQWFFQPVVAYVGGAARYGRPLALEVLEPL